MVSIQDYLPFPQHLREHARASDVGERHLHLPAALALHSENPISKLTDRIQSRFDQQTQTESIFKQKSLRMATPDQKLALFNNEIYTVQDALENQPKLKHYLGLAQANKVLVDLALKFGTAKALPTAAQAQAIVSNLYDPIEENNIVSKRILNTQLSHISTIIPTYPKYDSLRSGIQRVSAVITKANIESDDFEPPTIREAVGTKVQCLDDFENKLESQEQTPSIQNTLASFRDARKLIRTYYQDYKQVDSIDMFSYRLSDLGIVKSYPQAIQSALFDSEFYFYYQAIDNFELLKKSVGEVVALQIATTIEQEEDLSLTYKFGSDVTSLYKYELNLESTAHQSWVGYLSHTFANEKVQRFFPQPSKEEFEWLQFFIDQKDAPIFYDADKGVRFETTYERFFKKISAYYLTFGLKDKNTQERIKIHADTLKHFIQNLFESAEGTAVLMNLRARSQAFYLSKNGAKYGFHVDYIDGNLNQFKKYVDLIKYPRLSLKFRNMLKPDPTWFNLEANQSEFTRFQQDAVLKMLILNPGFNGPNAENIVIDASLAILVREGFDNGEVYIQKIGGSQIQQQIFNEASKKMLKEVLIAYDAFQQSGPTDENEIVKKKFERLSEMQDGIFDGQEIYSAIQEAFNSLIELLAYSEKSLLQLAKALAGFLATAGALGVIIVAICGKGSMSPVEWVNFGTGTALMIKNFYETFVAFKEIAQTIGKWIIDQCGKIFLKHLINPETLKFIGKVLSKFAQIVVIICTIYFIYVNFNTAVNAFQEGDVKTAVLSIVCGVLLIVSLHIQIMSLLIASSMLSVVGAALAIIIAVIQQIISYIQDDEVTVLLKDISKSNPELIESQCISV